MEDKIKILLVDDDEDDFIITRENINIDEIPTKKYSLDWVSSYTEGLKAIQDRKYDVYLIDYRLGAHTGLELIREAMKAGCSSPLILLTGQGDREIDEQAMKAGASDYLVKGNMNPVQLERAIRYSLEHAIHLEKIRVLNLDLEKRVHERTSELDEVIKKLEITNDSLKKAQINISKALQKERELNELKSRFVTMASHEFRTPLSTILSSVSLISKYKEAEEQDKRDKHIERIKSSVHNLTGILNDFLSLSQLEEGKAQNKPVLFNFENFTAGVVEELKALLKKEQVIIHEHEGRNEDVCLDKQLLKNVLINLISNAIKYSSEGKKINVRTKHEQGIVSIEIQDQGIGIPKEDQQHLFSRFFRANNATNVQGTGLGLNIVKKYIELLGGEIDFSSEQNKGSVFTVKIFINK
jgi:signal transduction histidine kinase